MNRVAVAQELVKVARLLQADSSLLDQVLRDSVLQKLEHHVDEQTWDLAVQVFQKLQEKFRMSSDEQEALNRLLASVKSGSMSDSDAHRNNIFKAAHALGIKLPSGSF
jgi:hypothetical protein